MTSPSHVQIGPWLADPTAGELVRDGETVRIEPKMMEVLLALAERAGEAVTRDELLDRVWPDVVVSEDALSGTISKLRRALGDDARTPAYIETIPRRGYRLVAPVTYDVETSPSTRSGARRVAPRWRLPPLVALVGAVALVGITALVLWPRPAGSPSGSEVRPLTRAAGTERYPALSPEGDRLAFAARTRDSTFYHLFVQPLDAGVPVQRTDARADDVHPAWSPDGRTLAFLRCRSLRCYVYSMPALGGTPRRRAEASVSPYGLAWAPEDDAVLVVDRDTTTAPYRVLRLDLATGERRALTAPPEGALGDLVPAVGPDGTIAFVRHDRRGGEDLYLVTDDPERPRRLTEFEGRLRGFAWDADGRGLLFSTRREGGIGLWRVSPDGAPPRQASASGLRDPGAIAIRDGRAVVEAWTVEVNLWEASAATGYAPAPLLVSASADREPALSSDGTRLAFVSDRSGTPELWAARRDGSAPLRLTDFGGAGLGAPAWFPDGETLAFEVQRDGHASIYTVGADGGTPQPLTDGDGYDVAPRPSRDGRWVYFGSDRTGEWEVWKVSRDGSTTVRITDVGGFASMESPDGRTLYFTRYFEPGLWAMPVGGGPAEIVTEALGALDWGNWAATDAGLVWIERSDGGAVLVRTDPATGATERLASVEGVPVREVGLSADAPGQTIVLSRVERLESDLLLLDPVP